MEKQNIIKIIKKYWIIPLLILKSFFLAITQVAWGLVSLGLLGWVNFFIIKEYPLIDFPNIIGILQFGINLILNHLNLFVWTFFIIYMYNELNELLRFKR